ncbi:carbohydrate-binding protein [Echinicola pacifica]|uniref:Carbohydrate-binding protein n=1 Tax=Echinicola pacifica TaxID=346377 RepID=A0A918PYM6_9BACT|nr:RagB/SusD family nutrient uptake outer membrane protein [Echinicola pacifica]GGZ25281.1 carbohydrate-binding protein [Echinicola pacifica]
MKYRIIYIATLLLILGNTSCVDYLDKSPDATAFSEEEVFSSYEKSQQFIDQLLIPSYWDADPWDDLAWGNEKINGLPLQMNGSRDRITDDCTVNTGSMGERMWRMRKGDFYAGQNDQDFRWEPNHRMRFIVKWRAIRIANMSIAYIDQLTNATEEQRANILGLAYFMRAHFYFQLVQNWGGMPWVDAPLDPTSDMDLPRDDYATSMQKIAESFDMAAEYLPEVVPSSEWGRPSRLAAMAYKAKALLWAASPFANPDNNQQLWVDAAVAAGEALAEADQSGYYYLVPLEKWRNLFHGVGEDTFHEVLFGILHKNKQWKKGQPDWRYSGIKSKAFGSGSGGEPVMENLAQCFTWSNGDPIDYSTEEFKKTPFTGDGVNHTGRDPRFDLTLLYNGQDNPMTAREGRKVEIWNEAYDNSVAEELKIDGQGSPVAGYTITGYYNWKLKADANYRNNARTSHLFNFIRLADLYLFYAEAANRAWGPNSPAQGVNGFSKSSVQVLNELRARANMPAFDNSTPSLSIGSVEEFEQKIRNEVRIETAFEGKRFYHLRRWYLMTDPGVMEQRGLYIKKTGPDEFEYSVVRVDETHQIQWEEKHYLFPIENSNIFLGPNFKQNPGW